MFQRCLLPPSSGRWYMAIGTSEMSVSFYESTCNAIIGDSHLHTGLCENPKSQCLYGWKHLKKSRHYFNYLPSLYLKLMYRFIMSKVKWMHGTYDASFCGIKSCHHHRISQYCSTWILFFLQTESSFWSDRGALAPIKLQNITVSVFSLHLSNMKLSRRF